MSQDQVKELLNELKQEQLRLSEAINKSTKVKKDRWDKIAAAAPIISGILISTMAGYFTFTYNQQQLRLQEIQTIEKFIPHLMGSEKSKKAAILAMSSLTNTQLAARFASLFASEGTVSALKSIATTGDTKDRDIATEALQRTLEGVAERYTVENRDTEAEDALNEALELKERALGSDHPDVPRMLDKLSELYKAHGKYRLADALLKRSLAIKEKIYGADDPAVATTLKCLAEIYKLEGNSSLAEPLYKRALAIDEKTMKTAPDKKSADPTAAQAQESDQDPAPAQTTASQDSEPRPAKTTTASPTPISDRGESDGAEPTTSNM